MTSAEAGSLVTQDMIDRRGVWGDETLSPPVSESDIRKWAIAVYWPEKPPPLFWDAEYAKTTRWRGIIAPEDFNPFAWPVEQEIPPERANAQAAGVGQRSMNGGQVDTYFAPIRPGDVIRSRTRLAGWNERETRLGLTLFIEIETEWYNQRDELVKRRIYTGIRY